jgi:hypothetical protein
MRYAQAGADANGGATHQTYFAKERLFVDR